jgi:hypothetical protein
MRHRNRDHQQEMSDRRYSLMRRAWSARSHGTRDRYSTGGQPEDGSASDDCLKNSPGAAYTSLQIRFRTQLE